jgi:hypothetical protein
VGVQEIFLLFDYLRVTSSWERNFVGSMARSLILANLNKVSWNSGTIAAFICGQGKSRKISVKTAGYIVTSSEHSDEQKDAAIP